MRTMKFKKTTLTLQQYKDITTRIIDSIEPSTILSEIPHKIITVRVSDYTNENTSNHREFNNIIFKQIPVVILKQYTEIKTNLNVNDLINLGTLNINDIIYVNPNLKPSDKVQLRISVFDDNTISTITLEKQ